MKVIEAIKKTKGLKENFIIKSKKVETLVNEADCMEFYFNGTSFVFITKQKYKVDGTELQLIIRADQMKNGSWWIKQN